MKDRIKKIRKCAGLTQEKFAERLGIKRNTVATYETGKSEPMDNIIVSMCREFEINEEWLRTGKGEMKKDVDEDFGSICADIGANDTKAREAIMKYYELTPEDKKLWWAWMERFIKK